MSDTKWSEVRDENAINNALEAFKANGITALHVKTGAEAKAKVLDMIPKGAQVFANTSKTVDAIGLTEVLNESGDYQSVRKLLFDEAADKVQKKYQGAAPEWMVGSVHAVTEDGKAVIASNTGSQLPGYSYGAEHVVWVVGTQKLVKDLDEALKRLYDYVLPLEAERARKAYGIPEDMPGSFISKLLIVNREINPARITIVLVDEVLGF